MKDIKRILIWVFVAVFAISLLLGIGLAGVRLFGLEPVPILVKDMEPEYRSGTLLYVKKASYRTLAPGDVITFMVSQEQISTSRIVEVIPEDIDPEIIRFRTQGDANDSADDGLVLYRNIIGTPVGSIPLAGYIANILLGNTGYFVAAFLALVLAGLAVSLSIMYKPEKKPQPAAPVGKYAHHASEDFPMEKTPHMLQLDLEQDEELAENSEEEDWEALLASFCEE